MKQRRYLGTSHLFNVDSNHEFRNGFDIKVDSESVSVEMNSPVEPERKVQLIGCQEDARAYRRVLLKMERESLRARRQAGEFAFFKPKSTPKPTSRPLCDQCGGLGGNQDEEGNWIECEACR